MILRFARPRFAVPFASFTVAAIAVLAAACGGEHDVPSGDPGTEPAASPEGGGSGPGGDDAGAGSPSDANAADDVANGRDEDAAPPPPPPQPGLLAEYYAEDVDLVVTRVEPTLDQNWGDAAPDPKVGADHFSARWTGTLTAPATATYAITTATDDGVRVWIDGKLVIDDWHPQFVTTNQAPVDLVAGKSVPIRVEYFEIDQKASAQLRWSASAAGIADEVIPASALTSGAPSGMPSPKPPYANPVTSYDCPDPGVIALGTAAAPLYAMVCTGGKFPVRTSESLIFWDATKNAILPSGKAPWATDGSKNWAPEIHKVGSGYVAYFTALNAANGHLGIGAATATSPTGPFTAQPKALVTDDLGAIDATFFEDDDGSRYLIWKEDGNAQGKPTPIFAQKLNADGLSFASGTTPKQILVNDTSTWEGGVVEGPWLVKRGGAYYLFYSGNVYDYRYRTGVAKAPSVLGPYTKHGDPLLANNARFVGPGHGSVVPVAPANGSVDYWVYHAWTNDGSGKNDTTIGRQVLVDKITWNANGTTWPTIANGSPSSAFQAWPGAN